jgi:large subunit ribosomal protein L30e
MTEEKEIKFAIKEKKLVIGSRGVFKNLKQNIIKSVICASNCPEATCKDLEYYGKNFDIELKKFKGNSRQLGEMCAKPFNVSVLGIKK